MRRIKSFKLILLGFATRAGSFAPISNLLAAQSLSRRGPYVDSTLLTAKEEGEKDDSTSDNDILYFKQPKSGDKKKFAPDSKTQQDASKTNKTSDARNVKNPNLTDRSEAGAPESTSHTSPLKSRLTGGRKPLQMSAPIGNDMPVGLMSHKAIPESTKSPSPPVEHEGPASPYTSFGAHYDVWKSPPNQQRGNNLKSLLTGGNEPLQMSAPVGNEVWVAARKPPLKPEWPASPYTSLASAGKLQQGVSRQQEQPPKTGSGNHQQQRQPQQRQTGSTLKSLLTGGSEPLKMSAPLDNNVEVAPFMSIGKTPSSKDGDHDGKVTDPKGSGKKNSPVVDPNSKFQPPSSSRLKTLLTGGPNSLTERGMNASMGKRLQVGWIAADEQEKTARASPSTAALQNASLKAHYDAWKSISPGIDSKNLKSLLSEREKENSGGRERKPPKKDDSSAPVDREVNMSDLSNEKPSPNVGKSQSQAVSVTVSPPVASVSDGNEAKRAARTRSERALNPNPGLKSRVAGGNETLKMSSSPDNHIELNRPSAGEPPKVNDQEIASKERAPPHAQAVPPPRRASDVLKPSTQTTRQNPSSFNLTATAVEYAETSRDPIAPSEESTSPSLSPASDESRKTEPPTHDTQEKKSSRIPQGSPAKDPAAPSSFGARYDSWKSKRSGKDTKVFPAFPADAPASPAASFAARYTRKPDPSKTNRKATTPDKTPLSPVASFSSRFDSWKSPSRTGSQYRDGLWAGEPQSANQDKHEDLETARDQSAGTEESPLPSAGNSTSPSEAASKGTPFAASFGARYDSWKPSQSRLDSTYRDGLWNGGPDSFEMSAGRDHHRYVGAPGGVASTGRRPDKAGLSRFAPTRAGDSRLKVGVPSVSRGYEEKKGRSNKPGEATPLSAESDAFRAAASPLSAPASKPSPRTAVNPVKEVNRTTANQTGAVERREIETPRTGAAATPASMHPSKRSFPGVQGSDLYSPELKRKNLKSLLTGGTESLRVSGQQGDQVSTTASLSSVAPLHATASSREDGSKTGVNDTLFVSDKSLGDGLSDVERRQILQEVRQHLDILKELEGVISEEEMAKRKSELFAALPPLPPASDDPGPQ